MPRGTGMPFLWTPLSCGMRPVSIATCEGAVSGIGQVASAKTTPSRASASRPGVSPSGPPKAPTRSARSVSIEIQSTFAAPAGGDFVGCGVVVRQRHSAAPMNTTSSAR